MQDELQSEEQSATTEPMSTANEETTTTVAAPAYPGGDRQQLPRYYRRTISEKSGETMLPRTARWRIPPISSSRKGRKQRIYQSFRQEIELRAGRPESANDDEPAEVSDANLSGRERARLRQQETCRAPVKTRPANRRAEAHGRTHRK